MASAYRYAAFNESEDDTDDDSESYYSTDSDSTVITTVREHFLPEIPPDRADLYRTKATVQPAPDPMITASSAPGAASFDMSGVKAVDPQSQFNNTTLKVNTVDKVATIMFSSDDRDRHSYNQPTQFQLHLPRTYRNITSIQITQLKLLTSFLYFRDSKYNTSFKIYEQGRIKLTDSSTNNIITVKIREGTYNINTLINEISTQMNKTPVFFDYPNGFDDFARLFPTSGDFALNFNQPGDYYYDSLIDKFIDNPNMNYIVTRYFPSRYASQFSYTSNQTLVAYYYPVLKEVFLDTTAILSIDMSVSSTAGMTTADIYKRVVFEFQGLDDTVVLELIRKNQGALDTYRLENTFHYSLVNKYNWSYDNFNNRITVSSTNLNTSIQRYLTNITAQYTSDTLNDLSYTAAQMSNIAVQRNQSSAVVTDMYNYLQTGLAKFFAVNFGSYPLETLANQNSILYLQNALDVSGVFTQYSLDYFNAKEAGTVKIPPDFTARPAPQEPRWKLDTLSTATVDFDAVNMGIKNNPYNFILSNQIITNTYVVDPETSYINTANLTQTTDIVTNVPASKYAVFRFRSPVRQTIQLETLSRPLFYRYPEYNNASFGGAAPYFFDKTLQYIDNSAADITDIVLRDITPPAFGVSQDDTTIINTTLTTTQISYTRTDSVHYYTFVAPDISGIEPLADASGAIYTVHLRFETTAAQFNSPVSLFMYHDRAAFMTDARSTAVRHESPYNYNLKATATATDAVIDITVRLHTGDTYYLIFRSDSVSIQDIPYVAGIYWTQPIKVSHLIVDFNAPETEPMLEFPYKNPLEYLAAVQDASSINYYFARTYDPAFVRLPIDMSNSITPNDQLFALTFPPGWSQIGYDASGVSTDLTDYIVFDTSNNLILNPSYTASPLLQDPTTQYIFQYLSPYSQETTNYFYSSSNNALLGPNSQGRPTYVSTVAPEKREYKIVHYIDTHFITPHSGERPTNIDSIRTEMLARHEVYDLSAADLSQSYSYVDDAHFPGHTTLQLGEGVCGITFTPPEGWWDATTFTFKSANWLPNNPNADISFVGVYALRSISMKNTTTIKLENSLVAMNFASSQFYPPPAAFTQGLDPKCGSYYTFERIPDFEYTRPDIHADGLAGFTSYPGIMTNSEDDLYTIIAFNSAGDVIPFHMLAGSLVPRPDISVPIVSSTYNGITSPTGTQLIEPSGSDTSQIYQSQYQQSVPINTQVLNYIDNVDIFRDAYGIREYNTGEYIGDTEFKLRSIGYASSIATDNYYVLAGDIYGTRPVGDVYKIENPGVEPRKTYFINHFELAVPSGQQIVWWGATSTQAFALTREIASAPPICHIYTFDPLADISSTPLIHDMSFIAVDSSGAAMDLSTISTRRAFYMTTAGDFMLSSPMIAASSHSILYYSRSNGRFTSRTFNEMSEAVIDAYVHYEETVGENLHPTFHILTRIAETNTVILYDIRQVSGGATHITGGQTYYSSPQQTIVQIQPLFSEGIYSLRTNSTGTAFFLSTLYNNRYICITDRIKISQIAEVYDARLEVNEQVLPYDISHGNTSWQIGANYSIFFQTRISHSFDFGNNPWQLMGNTQIGSDRQRGIYNAWQLFYPVIKLSLNKRSNIYNSMIIRTDINQPVTGDIVPESYRTQAFFYRDLSSLVADVSGPTGWKWGAETQYTMADVSFSGYEYNSYMYNINVGPSLSGESDYYVAIRGYSPAEDFQTLVRWRLPNRYDFGQLSLATLITEISDSRIRPQLYNPNYSTLLGQFDSIFDFSDGRIFGGNSLANYAGSNITTTDFTSFYSKFQEIYNTYITANNTISTFNDTVNTKVLQNMKTYFNIILPDSYFSRSKLGSSLPYDLLFKSSIAPELVGLDLEQEWGIGWNLGFDKKDYTDNIVYHAPTFFKILDDYIYLRINDEQGMNTLDITGKENLKETRESRGAIQQYNAKLLLANFGNYSQTLIQNPLYFNPPIGKMDRLKLTWMDSKGQVIDNTDCEWSAVINITERVERATVDSALVQGQMR